MKEKQKTSKLNEKNNITEKIIHLMVTSLCNRNCKFCCNKQYDLNDISYVTDEELRRAHTLCLTGGEPFAFVDPCEIAKYYKVRYPNIKNVYVYTNAVELSTYLLKNNLSWIDGVNVSLKNKQDVKQFDNIIKCHPDVLKMRSNLLYIFEDNNPTSFGNFSPIKREWQENFQAAPDSIFRRDC